MVALDHRRHRRPGRAAIAAPWLAALQGFDPASPLDEVAAERASDAFKTYLSALRAGPEAVATTPPGRFLMPGDLAGSPALTFAPLDRLPDTIDPDSLAGLMQRRFEAYKSKVVTPFFRDHFQRVDRQIVLVDVLSAVDAGPTALAELEEAIDAVLLSLNIGRNSILSRLFAPRADRVLFAATKADHLHQTEPRPARRRLLRLLVSRAMRRTEAAGARVGTVALASVRATRETTVHDDGEVLRAVAGTPEAGEVVGDETFDGQSEAAVFPGELPARPEAVLEGAVEPGSLRFPRFRPPLVRPDALGRPGHLPQIRLDRAMQFLIGDRLA